MQLLLGGNFDSLCINRGNTQIIVFLNAFPFWFECSYI